MAIRTGISDEERALPRAAAAAFLALGEMLIKDIGSSVTLNAMMSIYLHLAVKDRGAAAIVSVLRDSIDAVALRAPQGSA